MKHTKCIYIHNVYTYTHTYIYCYMSTTTAYHSGFLDHFISILARNVPPYISSLADKLAHVCDQHPNRSTKVRMHVNVQCTKNGLN